MGNLTEKELSLLGDVGILKPNLKESIDRLVEDLEAALRRYNESYERGIIEISNERYDRLCLILEKLNPQSEVLNTLWSEDYTPIDEELDRLFVENPMLSINTVKDRQNRAYVMFKKYCVELGTPVEFLCSMKLDGHGVRVVYSNGELVKATTRGRATLGRDITRHMRLILGDYKDEIAHLSLVEIRGEILLSYDNLAVARQYNPDIKSAFTGVSSLIRDSASDEEIKLLDFLAYRFISDRTKGASRVQEFELLEDFGFETPVAFATTFDTEEDFDDVIDHILENMETEVHEYPYKTDGVVVEINDWDLFIKAEGVGSKARGGNIALKMGYWQQETYCARIEDVILTVGKGNRKAGTGCSKIPVALIEPTMTDTGATVKRVPLFNLATMHALEAYPGEYIYFKFGGESGVVPCKSSGDTLDSSISIQEEFDDMDLYPDE